MKENPAKLYFISYLIFSSLFSIQFKRISLGKLNCVVYKHYCLNRNLHEKYFNLKKIMKNQKCHEVNKKGNRLPLMLFYSPYYFRFKSIENINFFICKEKVSVWYFKGGSRQFLSESENLVYSWVIHNPGEKSSCGHPKNNIIWGNLQTTHFGETPQKDPLFPYNIVEDFSKSRSFWGFPVTVSTLNFQI